MTEEYVAISTCMDWADEISFHEHWVTSKQQYEGFVEEMRNHKDSWEHSVGTNEGIYFADGRDLIAGFMVKSITKEEHDAFIKITGRNMTRHFPLGS